MSGGLAQCLQGSISCGARERSLQVVDGMGPVEESWQGDWREDAEGEQSPTEALPQFSSGQVTSMQDRRGARHSMRDDADLRSHHQHALVGEPQAYKTLGVGLLGTWCQGAGGGGMP